MTNRDNYYADPLLSPPECDMLCRFRNCYCKYEDKGSFSVGKGYTDYRDEDDFRPVCGTRQSHGCPDSRGEITDNVDLARAISTATELFIEHRKGNRKVDIRVRGYAQRLLEAVSRHPIIQPEPSS